jgi:hypothetical protein
VAWVHPGDLSVHGWSAKIVLHETVGALGKYGKNDRVIQRSHTLRRFAGGQCLVWKRIVLAHFAAQHSDTVPIEMTTRIAALGADQDAAADTKLAADETNAGARLLLFLGPKM